MNRTYKLIKVLRANKWTTEDIWTFLNICGACPDKMENIKSLEDALCCVRTAKCKETATIDIDRDITKAVYTLEKFAYSTNDRPLMERITVLEAREDFCVVVNEEIKEKNSKNKTGFIIICIVLAILLIPLMPFILTILLAVLITWLPIMFWLWVCNKLRL